MDRTGKYNKNYKGMHEEYNIWWIPTYDGKKWKYYGIHQCEECKKYRIIAKRTVSYTLKTKKEYHGYCLNCANAHRLFKKICPENNKTIGGKFINKQGYIIVTVYSNDPLYKYITRKGHSNISKECLYHRYLIMKKIGRKLEIWEHVHHINGNKRDNRLSNLELLPSKDHSYVTKIVTENNRLKNLASILEWQMI